MCVINTLTKCKTYSLPKTIKVLLEREKEKKWIKQKKFRKRFITNNLCVFLYNDFIVSRLYISLKNGKILYAIFQIILNSLQEISK